MNSLSLFQILFVCLCIGCGTCIISLLFTRCLLFLLPLWGMVDKPDFKRHIHKKAVPRGGGLGMLIAFIGVINAYFWLSSLYDHHNSMEILKLTAPLAILLPLGVLDDKYGLRAKTKFIWQIIAAALAWFLGFRMQGFFGMIFPTWLGCLLTIFWIVALINAFNMIDGVDGLAGGVAIISSLCMGTIAISQGHSAIAITLCAFAGALLGFLFFNWNPARLFMGDTGSMFIGYILAVTGIVLNANIASVASIGIPLLACGIPVLDILLAVWRRVIGTPMPINAKALDLANSGDATLDDTGEESPGFIKRVGQLLGRLGSADQKHLHHRLLRYYGNNQQKTVWSIYGLALGLGGVGIICCFLPGRNLLLAIVIILGTFSFIINRLAIVELWNSTEAIYQGFQTARAGILLSHAINPLMDLLCVSLAYYITSSHPVGIAALLRNIVVVMIVLMLSRNYRVFWNFAALDDYCRLFGTLALGFLAAWAMHFIFPGPSETIRHFYACCAASTFIVLERLLIHFVRNTLVRRHSTSSLADDNTHPKHVTVLVGINATSRLYRNMLFADLNRAAREQLAGIVGRDPRFRHGYCFGMKVLGGIQDLQKIFPKYGITKLVVTIQPTPQEKAILEDFCKENHVALSLLSCKEETIIP